MRHHPSTGKRSRQGKRKDLNDTYFRSRWEANYARYLNWLKERGDIEGWEFEADTFEFPVKRGSRFYTPDFKVTSSGAIEYHEVKGYMDQPSRTKLSRMSKYYPQVRVVLIDRSYYADLEKKMSRVLVGWE